VRGALRRQADAALTQARRDTGRSRGQVLDGLLQLVAVDVDREPTRRRVVLSDLPDPVVCELDAFVDRHLLTTERRGDGVVHIAVAHEQFLVAWEPLREAISRVRPMLAARQQLDAADVRDDPRPAACAVAGRGLDRTEWARHVGTVAYFDTCSD
jgi:hypothetical protein